MSQTAKSFVNYVANLFMTVKEHSQFTCRETVKTIWISKVTVQPDRDLKQCAELSFSLAIRNGGSREFSTILVWETYTTVVYLFIYGLYNDSVTGKTSVYQPMGCVPMLGLDERLGGRGPREQSSRTNISVHCMHKRQWMFHFTRTSSNRIILSYVFSS
jgi:hypothetical protein